tara:strand:+ start:220 stop:1293 length:1074 start_codon:yes stop_codon:yes gene_type:complete
MFKSNDLEKINNYWNNKSISKKIKILKKLYCNKILKSGNLSKITNKYPRELLYKYFFNQMFINQLGGEPNTKSVDEKLYTDLSNQLKGKIELIRKLINESEKTSEEIKTNFTQLKTKEKNMDSTIKNLKEKTKELESEKVLIDATKESLENFQDNFFKYLAEKMKQLSKINDDISKKSKEKILTYEAVQGDPEIKDDRLNALPLPKGWKVAFNKTKNKYYYYDSNNEACKKGLGREKGCREYYERPISDLEGNKQFNNWFSKKNNEGVYYHYNKELNLSTYKDPRNENIEIASGWYARYVDNKLFYIHDTLDIKDKDDPRNNRLSKNGYRILYDKEYNRFYYYNETTKVTTWDAPKV